MHGWIILDKPSGITSAHAVARVKRLLKPKKIGHAGTLDPLASGVLPLALGEATKTVAYMMHADKSYGFTVAWGEERDTDDSQGKVVRTSEKRPARAEIEAILPEFTGLISQMPPDYSAIQIGGVRAYDAAREGKALALTAREVKVDSLAISPSPAQREREYQTSFICHCGKGTYVRSLARDMGRKLGCFGHITALRRLGVGKFTENQAISLEVLEEMMHKGDLGFLQPVEAALDDILARDIDEDQAARLKRGQNAILSNFEGPYSGKALARLHGRLVAICEQSGADMKPVRVFNL